MWFGALPPASGGRDPAGAASLAAPLRSVLEHYLGPDLPAILRRCEHCGHPRHGRPQVDGAVAVDFSVTHTRDLYAVAVVGHGRVGIDAEPREELVRDLAILARDVLTAAEQAAWSRSPDAERGADFLRLWTRKEAAVKVSGHGIVVSLASMDVRGDTLAGLPVEGAWARRPVHLRDLALPGVIAALGSTLPLALVRTFALPGPGEPETGAQSRPT